MNHWKEAGNFYGYPDCCSDWFVKRLNMEVPFELDATQLKVDDGSGFIPCPSCAKKIDDGETTREELITNRVCSLPYPHDHHKEKELEKYMDRKMKHNEHVVYEGNYIDVRDGIRYQVKYSYQLRDGNQFNEKELEKKELGPGL